MSEFNEDILRLFAAEPVEKIAKAPRGAFSEFLGRYGLARPTKEYTDTATKLQDLESRYTKLTNALKQNKRYAKLTDESDAAYAERLDDVLKGRRGGAAFMEDLKKTRESLKAMQNKALTGRIVGATTLGLGSAAAGAGMAAPFAYAKGRKRED